MTVAMASERQGEIILLARLDLERYPLTSGNLALALLRWLSMTLRVLATIYWQTLRLKRKGVPFRNRPE
nr:DUF1365 family protein [Geobacter grbiciae]